MSDAPISRPLTIRPLAESGLLLEFADVIDPAVVDQVMALTRAIDAARPAGLLDVVPSYRTILLAFDPARTDGDQLSALVHELATDQVAVAGTSERTVTIPVAYGGDFGPDLAGVAAHSGLAPDGVCRRHAGADYRVACMGFSPGFAFLVGLPGELAMPRRSTPRTRVPTGSVAIGGAQTGVYPSETPGGWNIIGRTPVSLFDVARPEPFLLQPGDAVRFEAISKEEFDAIAADQRSVTEPPA